MINSPNSKRIAAFLLALPLAIALTVNASAQSKPRSLVPKAAPLAPPSGFSSSEQKPAIAGSAPKTVIEGSGIQGKMIVEGLKAIDSSAIGLLNDDEKSLGPQMWNGTARTRISHMITGLPTQSTSPVLQELLRRVLLTAALVPSATDQENKDDLLALRFQKLYDTGLLDELLKLNNRVQKSMLSPDTRKLVQETYLLLGKTDVACNEAAEMVQEKSDPFWAKSQLFCRALKGQHERAEMGAILLEESGENDPLFFDFLASMAGEKIKFDLKETPLSAHHIAMARATHTENMLEDLMTLKPAYLRAAMQTGGYSDSYRLASGWRGAALGIVRLSELEPLLANEKLVQDFKGPFLLGDYQLAKTSTNAETKQEALKNIVRQISASGAVFPTIKFLSTELSSLQPDSKQTSFLFGPARIFLALEKLETASEWGRQARKAVLSGNIQSISEAQSTVGRLDPLLLIAGASGEKEWDAKMFLRWNRAHGNLSNEERVAKGNILLSLLDSVGVNVPVSHWNQLADQNPHSPARGLSPAMIRSLMDAAANNKVGETVSLVLAGLGDGALEKLDASSLLVAIAALRQVGLQREARSLALEIAIAHNL